jgi:O-antigen/teichoic acid export membrane protein
MEANSSKIEALSSDQYSELKKKTFSGVGVLVLRSILVQPISFLGFIFLSVFLQRWELGVFWAVSEIVGFLGYFSDVGLAAAVIQKKEEPTKEELRATFIIQQILVLLCILVALLLLPF